MKLAKNMKTRNLKQKLLCMIYFIKKLLFKFLKNCRIPFEDAIFNYLRVLCTLFRSFWENLVK